MSNYKAFVAHSSGPGEINIISFFENVLKAVGIEPAMVAGPSVQRITDKVKAKISESPIFVAVVTRRHKLPDGRYSVPPWIVFETGLASRERKVICLVLEQGIEDVGPFRDIPGAPLRFDRDKLPGALEHAVAYFKDAIAKVAKDPTAYAPTVQDRFGRDKIQIDPEPGYLETSSEKEVTITPGGHGIVKFEKKILVSSDRFKGIKQRFRLNEYVPQKFRQFPPLEKMLQAPVNERYQKGFFCYRLLSPVSGQVGVIRLHVLDDGYDIKYLEFSFDPKPLPGHSIKYGWAWSFPRLFSPTDEDSSMYECWYDVEDLNFILRFEHIQNEPWRFAVEPILIVLDPFGVEQSRLPTTPYTTLYYTKYEWRGHKGRAGYLYNINWVPRKKRGR